MWESSSVCVSKVSELNSLDDGHKTNSVKTCILLNKTGEIEILHVIPQLHPHTHTQHIIILNTINNWIFCWSISEAILLCFSSFGCLCIMSVPDFESESVEYLLPSAQPSLKSGNGPLFPVNQVRDERWQQCLIPVCLCPPQRHQDVWTEVRLVKGLACSYYAPYLIIGSRRSLILDLL